MWIPPDLTDAKLRAAYADYQAAPHGTKRATLERLADDLCVSPVWLMADVFARFGAEAADERRRQRWLNREANGPLHRAVEEARAQSAASRRRVQRTVDEALAGLEGDLARSRASAAARPAPRPARRPTPPAPRPGPRRRSAAALAALVLLGLAVRRRNG